MPEEAGVKYKYYGIAIFILAIAVGIVICFCFSKRSDHSALGNGDGFAIEAEQLNTYVEEDGRYIIECSGRRAKGVIRFAIKEG